MLKSNILAFFRIIIKFECHSLTRFYLACDTGPWEPWTPCSTSCGNDGTRTRKRPCSGVCNNEQPEEADEERAECEPRYI